MSTLIDLPQVFREVADKLDDGNLFESGAKFAYRMAADKIEAAMAAAITSSTSCDSPDESP